MYVKKFSIIKRSIFPTKAVIFTITGVLLLLSLFILIKYSFAYRESVDWGITMQNSSLKFESPSNITLVPTQILRNIPTDFNTSFKWKTFNSPNNDFLLQYPADWTLQGSPPLHSGILILAPDNSSSDNTIDMIYLRRIIYSSIEEYMAKDSLSIDKHQISFDDLPAIIGVQPGSPSTGGSTITLYVNGGLLITQRFPGLYNKSKVSQFPKPKPDIISTIKFSL